MGEPASIIGFIAVPAPDGVIGWALRPEWVEPLRLRLVVGGEAMDVPLYAQGLMW